MTVHEYLHACVHHHIDHNDRRRQSLVLADHRPMLDKFQVRWRNCCSAYAGFGPGGHRKSDVPEG